MWPDPDDPDFWDGDPEPGLDPDQIPSAPTTTIRPSPSRGTFTSMSIRPTTSRPRPATRLLAASQICQGQSDDCTSQNQRDQATVGDRRVFAAEDRQDGGPSARSVVGAIADGTRPDYEARRREREESFPEPLGPLGRCGGCGGMVYSPCRLCRIRLMKDRELRLARAARRNAHEQSLRELLHRLRVAALRRDSPPPPPNRLVG